MKLTLESDLAFARALYKHNVLQKINKDLLPLSNGAIVIGCCDGDQICDRVDYLRKLMGEKGCPQRLHFITRHGGALRLLADSPLNKPGRTTSEDLLDEIEEAMRLKHINTLCPEAHCKCGACHDNNIPLKQVVELLCRSRKVLTERFPTAMTVKLMHIDWGQEKNYFKLSGEEYERSAHKVAYEHLKAMYPDRVTLTQAAALDLA